MKDTNVNLLRHHQVVEIKEEQRRLEGNLQNKYIEDRKSVNRQLNINKRMLTEQAPEPLPPQEREACRKQAMDLMETKIKPGMLSHEEMKRGKDGFSAAHLNYKWQQGTKADQMKFKNLILQSVAGTDEYEDPMIASIERYRPHRTYGYQANDLMPGHHAMSELAKENFPQDMGQEVNSALEQTKKREWTPERKKAFAEKMKAGREKKMVERESEQGQAVA